MGRGKKPAGLLLQKQQTENQTDHHNHLCINLLLLKGLLCTSQKTTHTHQMTNPHSALRARTPLLTLDRLQGCKMAAKVKYFPSSLQWDFHTGSNTEGPHFSFFHFSQQKGFSTFIFPLPWAFLPNKSLINAGPRGSAVPLLHSSTFTLHSSSFAPTVAEEIRNVLWLMEWMLGALPQTSCLQYSRL